MGGIEWRVVAALRKEGVGSNGEDSSAYKMCLGARLCVGSWAPGVWDTEGFQWVFVRTSNEFNKYLFIKHYLLFSAHHGRWAGLLYGGDVHACVSIHMCRHMYINTHLFIRFIGLFHYGLGWWLIAHFLALAKVKFLYFDFQGQPLI